MASIMFDSSDPEGMKKIRKKYGDTTEPFFSDSGLSISVFPDKIVTVDPSNNPNLIRKMIYWEDGTVEELYEQ